MFSALKARLRRSFDLTRDLIAHLDEPSLRLDLPGLASNRISAQLWCVVGARESYLRAIEAGGWAGFSCSLAEPRSKDSVLTALAATRERLDGLDPAVPQGASLDLALELLEHEVQHHGQLIRFVYANGLTFPATWTERYTV